MCIISYFFVYNYSESVCAFGRRRQRRHFSLQNQDAVNNGEDDMVLGFSHMRKKLWIRKKDDECCPVLGREKISFSL